MARLAQNWVEANFSSILPPITTLEVSFSNGYNFLKILELKQILTEDEMKSVQNGNTPNVVIKNMNILAKGLKSLNIQLSKQQIADIISEQPGSAADLIMSLKKNFENISTAPKWRNDSYKNAIKSLHPKPMRRLEGENEHETQFFSSLVGKGGKFREVDTYAQQKRYHDFDYDEEQRYKERLEKEHQSLLNRHADKRQEFLETLDRRIQQRLDVTSTGEKNWRANELSKKKRLTRHLQYELTVAAQIKEKKDWENTLHREEQMTGIEDYENNLKRNGLGGEDATAGEVLLPTTENSEAYLNRIEGKVENNWPTNSEISDFMQNLEKRTRELRLARQEKARRKRRLQVEQKAALLEIGGSSAPVSRSNSFDISSLVGMETSEQKEERKKKEYDELTAKAKIQRALQAEEGEKQVRIFAERQRMMAYENNDWNKKKEAVLASQAVRREEKRVRNYTTCKAIVVELITDLFPPDASAPVVATSQESEEGGDDIYHTTLLKDLKQIYQRKPNESMEAPLPIYRRVSSSNVFDLYPSIALLASNLARWKVESQPSLEDSHQAIQIYSRGNSFRESALEIFQQFQIYSESTETTPFHLNLSSEYLPLLNSFTSRYQEVQMCPQQCVYLLVGGAAHMLPKEILTLSCEWIGGRDMLALCTVSMAVEMAFKLRQSVTSSTATSTDTSVDPALVRFEHLYDLWSLNSISDRSLFPDLSFQASRVVSDIFDIISRISSGLPLLTTSESQTTELSNFKFSDTTLAILLAEILWLRDYVCSTVYSINGTTSLTPVVLVSFNFGTPDRPVVLKIFDWFLKGGSRLNLPEGDEEMANEINDEIATVPLEKGKKAAKPPAKGKKDKRDTTEVMQQISAIRGVVWLQPQEVGENMSPSLPSSSPPSSSSEDLTNVTQLYARLLQMKNMKDSSQSDRLESIKVAVEALFKRLNVPLLWLSDGSTFKLSHPFNAIEGILATILTTLPNVIPLPTAAIQSSSTDQQPSTEVLSIVDTFDAEVKKTIERIRLLLTTPQRIWLNHLMKTNPIEFESFRDVLNKIKEGMAMEADGLSGMILSLLLRIQQVRSEMLCEKAILSNNFKLTESQWKETCLEWRELIVEAEKNSKRTVKTQSSSDIVNFLQSKSRELECELGDLIDARHQRWMKQIDTLAGRLNSFLRLFCETICDVVKGLQVSFVSLLRNGLMDSLKLTALLEDAKYNQFPWALRADNKRDGMTRVENNLIRDEIRNQIGQLFYELNEIQTDQAVAHKDISFLATDLLSQIENMSVGEGGNSTVLMNAVMCEMKTEGYEMLTNLIRTLFDSLLSMKEVNKSVLSDLKDYSFQRNQYEHRLLREWVTELRESFQSTTPLGSTITFMNSYYYGVSDDPEHDGVPRSSLSNHGLLDMSEMVLSIRKTKSLAYELFVERSLSSSASSSSSATGSSDSSFDPFVFLTAAVQRMFDKSESLPHVWRQINKLRGLVDSICDSHPAANQSSEQFSVELVMRLLYSTLPLSIPSSYILKLGRKICDETLSSLSSVSPCVVKLSTILNILDKDKVLSAGWWLQYSSFSTPSNPRESKDLVVMAIEAIALTCAVPESAVYTKSSGKQSPPLLESVDVHLDKFLLALCYGPSLSNDSVTTLQRSLCCTVSSLSSGGDRGDEEQAPSSSSPTFTAQFLHESLTKLLLVGVQLIKKSEKDTNDEQNEPPPSLHGTVYGPVIANPAVLAWVTKINQLNEQSASGDGNTSGVPLLCKDLLEKFIRES